MALTIANLTTRVLSNIGDPNNDLWAAADVLNMINGKKDEAYDFISNIRADYGVKRDTTLGFAASSTNFNLPSDFLEPIRFERIVSTTDKIEQPFAVYANLQMYTNLYCLAIIMSSTGQWVCYRPDANTQDAWAMNIDYLPLITDQASTGSGFVLGPIIDRLIIAETTAELLASRKPKLAATWFGKSEQLKMQLEGKVRPKIGARHVHFID